MDEDQDDLLSNMGGESETETEDRYSPANKSTNLQRHALTYNSYTQKEFIFHKFFLILSSSLILILLPLYIDRVNVNGDVYSLILTNTILSSIVFTLLTIGLKCSHSKYRQINILKMTIKLSKLVQFSSIYFLSAILITYALDRKRVVCHIQDPLISLALVFALLFYFFCSKRHICSKRVFSIIAVIVGLFLSVDYSMCNEFKCRGYERQLVSDDTGDWTWRTHATWTSIYIAGLALYAFYFTRLEGPIVNLSREFSEENNFSSSVNTALDSVSTSRPCSPPENTNQELHQQRQKCNIIFLALWIHVIGAVIVLVLFTSNFIPHIGKGSSSGTVLNYTVNGVLCHFSIAVSCDNLWIISWLFLFGYIAFVIASLQFLMLTQSAVYTIATMTTAIPLAQIFWSLYSMQPSTSGFIIWNPSLSGELVSTLLGLPVVVVGLFCLYKLHYRDCHNSDSLLH